MGLIVFVALCREGIQGLIRLVELALGRFAPKEIVCLDVPNP
ncbi:MAG: hypothetical protein V5A22_04800 [Salinivenus sp.]